MFLEKLNILRAKPDRWGQICGTFQLGEPQEGMGSVSLPWVSNLSVNVPSATSSTSCNNFNVSAKSNDGGVQRAPHLQPPCIDGSKMCVIVFILLPKLLESGL